MGSQALPLILELLKDQGSVEEYQECLELVGRLLKTNVDREAAVANASTVVTETGNIEIFLDLLEHEDGLIGIMASDLLRDLHSLAPSQLETAIHDCPAGMNKLLHRVADRSREEVGNQALVLIQQLTLTNEEMKKTVAFNEGFDILFDIIVQEGGVSEPGVVVEDCLRVCCNILADSEICQRLFYSMGGSWRHTLVGFFDPEQLENSVRASAHDDEDGPVVAWFDQSTRLTCAVLAMTALNNSLGDMPAPKHQEVLAKDYSGIAVTAAMHWCARNGPVELIPLCLRLLVAIVKGNAATLESVKLSHLVMKPPKKGLHVPQNYESTALTFGIKIPGSEDRVAITIPSLLVERYISNDSTLLWSNHLRSQDTHTPSYGAKFASHYLEALDTILSGDPVSAGMILQHVLAPLPPSPDEDSFAVVDTGKPFGSSVLYLLVESCNKILQHLNNTALSVTPSAVDIGNAQKCANIFTLILIHGGALARELASAIHLGHVLGAIPSGNVALLPFILSVIARVNRMPHGHGLSVSLLRLLCAAGAACESSCKLMLENPSNLFVVDLAVLATGEETSSVLYDMHSYACFFLGTCIQALPDGPSKDSSATGKKAAETNDAFVVSRKMLLDIIDSKIGLTQFTDVLKRRVSIESRLLIQSTANDEKHRHALEHLKSATFVSFMNSHMEAIRKAIYDHYSGAIPTVSGGNNAESSALSKIIELQKDEINRLVSELAASKVGGDDRSHMSHRESNAPTVEVVASLEGLIAELKAELNEKRSKCEGFEQDLFNAANEIVTLNSTIEELKLENAQLSNSADLRLQDADAAQIEHSELENKLAAAVEKIAAMEIELNALKQKTFSDAATLMENENVISILQDDLKEANISWKKKYSLSEEEISNLRTELAVLVHRLSKPTDAIASPAEDEKLSVQIIDLKEQIITLSNDKKKLKEELDKANRSIGLMEEELRGPIPYEKSRESRISDLESRNGALKKQIWQLEGELEASKTAAFEGCYNILDALRPVLSAVVSGFQDVSLLTLELDQHRESNKIGMEALTAFISSDIASCCELVERRLNYALEYGSAAGIHICRDADLTTLQGVISWVIGIVDASKALPAIMDTPLAPDVTAAIIESLQNEVDEAVQTKLELENRYTALEEDALQLRAEQSVLEKTNAVLVQVNGDMNARVGVLAAQVVQLQADLLALEGANATLLSRDSVADGATIAAPLLRDIENLKLSNSTAARSFEAIRHGLAELLLARGNFFEASTPTEMLVDMLRMEIDSLISQNIEAEASVQKLNTDIVRFEQNAIIHEDELEQLKQQCSEFYERTHEHDELLSKFEQMVNDFSVAEDKIAHFNEVVDKLVEEKFKLAAERDKFSLMVSEMESKLKDSATLLTSEAATCRFLSDEVDCLKNLVADKDQRIHDVEASKQASVNAIKLQIIELEEKLLIVESEKRDVENKNISEKEPLAKIVASLRSERDLLKKELQSRDREIKETAAECSSLAGRVAGFTVAFEGLQEEFESVREEKDGIETDYRSACQNISALNHTNSMLQADIASRDTEIEELKAFVLFRENEMNQKHRLTLIETFSKHR